MTGKPDRYMDGVRRNKPPIGYCHCYLHKGYLTSKLLRKHKCLTKNCHYLEKYEQHRYWKERERKRKEKKERKNGITLRIERSLRSDSGTD